jgi:hypothetical protein
MEQQQIPMAQVEINFLKAILEYLEQKPVVEVKHVYIPLTSLIQIESKIVSVNIHLLQAIVDYLQDKPYIEVYQFVNVLTSQNKPQEHRKLNAPNPELNITEHVPEGFDVTKSISEQKKEE